MSGRYCGWSVDRETTQGESNYFTKENAMDLICPQCSRTETEPYEIGDLCSCGAIFVLCQSAPSSVLEGIRVSCHHDPTMNEWVVRIHHKKGMMSICGCQGEDEGKLVALCISAVIATSDCTFSIRSGGGEKTQQIECRNLVEFDAMQSSMNQAIDSILDFIT